MLTKIDSKIVRQTNDRLHRRWWRNLDAELVIDFERESDDVVWFELDFSTPNGRRECVRWGRAVGLQTGFVDTGENFGALDYKQSPVVWLDEVTRPNTIEDARERIRSSGLDPDVQDLVLSRLPH